MFEFDLSRASRRAFDLLQPVRVAALGLAVLGAGCASSKAPQQGPYAQIGGPGQQTMVAQRPLEIEDDGLPVQTPPPWRTKTEPDDPNEPFSPNYGRMPAAPAALPAPPRPTRVSTLDADALIAKAVAAHEIGRQ